uniref:Putative transmembrane protein n=2 Tax=Toxoplasma gondii TaxID=5811 RepID=A0A2G8Y027_TOXGO|nr:putative transmembrane protein [Toxoplasma gondii COUG]
MFGVPWISFTGLETAFKKTVCTRRGTVAEIFTRGIEFRSLLSICFQSPQTALLSVNAKIGLKSEQAKEDYPGRKMDFCKGTVVLKRVIAFMVAASTFCLFFAFVLSLSSQCQRESEEISGACVRMSRTNDGGAARPQLSS